MRLKRRKVPVTSRALHAASDSSQQVRRTTGKGASASPATSARLIRRFHVLLKRKAQLRKLEASASDSTSKWKEELRRMEAEMEEMGGLAVYQRMSTIGQGKDRGGGSESILIGWLDELGIRNEVTRCAEEGGSRLRLLEVGALKPDNYASCSKWMVTHPIDLRSNHPDIQEQDFLLMDLKEHAGGWDVISLSLVVNFVPEPRDRGRMLMNAFTMLKEHGLLFVALPFPCVSNSRYLTCEHFSGLMHHIGLETLREKWKLGGKMAYWLFRKRRSGQDVDASERAFDKKVVLREGNRNNFSILL